MSSNSAIQQSSNYIQKLVLNIIHAVIFSTVAISSSHSATVVATPGSLTGYTYLPPLESGGSPTSGQNVSTLQRCYYSPSAGDYTSDFSTKSWFDQAQITVYYKAIGGDGGQGVGTNGFLTAGGGGSTAILLNGIPIAIANGGDGGKQATEISGNFKIKKTDTLRFISGGAGGSPTCLSVTGQGTTCVGGGGGAGYRGGGGGATVVNAQASSPETTNTSPGKGGSATEGLGGYVLSTHLAQGASYPGTAGSMESGGTVGYPNTTAKGTVNQSTGEGMYGTTIVGYSSYSYYTSNHRATKTTIGSIQGPYNYYDSYDGKIYYYFGGAGGRLGSASMAGGNMPADSPNLLSWNNEKSQHQNPNIKWAQSFPQLRDFPQPTTFSISRQDPIASSCTPIGQANGYCTNRTSSMPGRIVLMYQAETCDIF